MVSRSLSMINSAASNACISRHGHASTGCLSQVHSWQPTVWPPLQRTPAHLFPSLHRIVEVLGEREVATRVKSKARNAGEYRANGVASGKFVAHDGLTAETTVPTRLPFLCNPHSNSCNTSIHPISHLPSRSNLELTQPATLTPHPPSVLTLRYPFFSPYNPASTPNPTCQNPRNARVQNPPPPFLGLPLTIAELQRHFDSFDKPTLGVIIACPHDAGWQPGMVPVFDCVWECEWCSKRKELDAREAKWPAGLGCKAGDCSMVVSTACSLASELPRHGGERYTDATFKFSVACHVSALLDHETKTPALWRSMGHAVGRLPCSD